MLKSSPRRCQESSKKNLGRYQPSRDPGKFASDVKIRMSQANPRERNQNRLDDPYGWCPRHSLTGPGIRVNLNPGPNFPRDLPIRNHPAHTIRERSHSFQSRALEKHKPVVTRSRSLSSANVLEQRYHKILKLQLQTLEEMIRSWKDELLPDGGLDLSDTRWSDYEVCGVPLEVRCPGAVLLPVKCALFWEGNKKLLAKVSSVKWNELIFTKSCCKSISKNCPKMNYCLRVKVVFVLFFFEREPLLPQSFADNFYKRLFFNIFT